ncbi:MULTISPECIES: transcription-repair coupling factor [unclassified Novosphingobium]|uniref:transcription-repair coupling factor n=1 Tax=unclassified Novosphingobium TaxID=2644732 RepID=UPI001493F77F|nr:MULTISPECIES: transcription-repair coupling factor [unclassified Novosphingobium]MBB3357062.1 transcription-repair coupling factor (superfamily II helicase) [Novosphingobium sp. BK256]MBB3373463.1 transcription-repair coupling factor (superfamily II helicase) [Novosphingobium sp. BK280]MBB3377833.1 transcription-repair coupling factor (superfamily II helicase) [Novosphingobium sp. BK258]MBB3418757.1 transcription-repair coupling factor (superfamily II helicase) [Novosphingobium sp. BK267]MB
MPDLTRILSARSPLTLASVARGAQPLVMADLARAAAAAKAQGRCVFITPDDAALRAVVESAGFFAPELDVIDFPAWDCLPFDRASPALSISARRLAALQKLQHKRDGRPQLLVTTINAVLQRTLSPFRIRESTRLLTPGVEIGRESLIALLQRQGYSRTDTVVDAGEYAVRGSIFDIYPTGLDHGLRLDFFGDELETLRLFDPSTQRSVQPVETHLLLPASEALLDETSIKRFRSRYREIFGANATSDALYQAVSEGRRLAGMEHWLPLFEERMVTLFDHLAEGDLVVLDAGAAKAAESRLDDIADYYAARTEAAARQSGTYRPLKPDALYLTREELDRALAGWPVHRATIFAEPESASVIDFGFASARDFTPDRAQGVNIYEAAAKHLAALGTRGRKPIVAAYTTGSRARLASLLAEAGKQAPALADTWQEALGLAASGRPVAVVLPLEQGFANDTLELLTEQDILGDRLVRRKKKRKDADAFLAELSALIPGDLVVHMDHGIGRYEGLEAITVGKSPHDCVQLTYAGGDKLYIPVENLDVLSRYGAESENVALDKLGGEGWQRRKARMRERILEMAGQLMATAALRALRQADVLAVDPASYGPFVDRFPWEETEDQDRAIDDVLGDMAEGKPMDRLVCGDVGFGKTEVALRAAFVAAMAGHQVAVIAPTTLLARQHYANFVERFSGFPIQIGRLSRLVPAKEAAETRAGLTAGTVDIVVGTHALLSKSVEFKRLGLVIVDEEQRFGVTHKEKLKELKTDVHVLTLTATPIPRTLQMAMSGLRELSTIQTPPVDRLAVRTYVMPWDDVTMREALMREHQRGGQSFIVVPRIADMAEVEDWLRLNVPEIRFVTAHGQMSPTEVEDRMSAFYEKKYEVLLSTTIIESGIDIPSANTIVLHRADRFGLAQLYQLRGRVGRGKLRAYAYLTYPEDQALSEVAEKRLKVLGDLDSLGAGFQLASHDLDLRGAGNLLGDEQSGHIKEVGFELYQSMLEDAILAAKAGDIGMARERDALSPQITLDAPIMIPEEYVPDLAVRMALYRRMNDAEGADAVEALAAEMIDRFGPLPPPTQNLLKLIEVKRQAIEARIAKIDVGPKGVLVSFHNDDFPDPMGLIAYVERLKGTAKLRPDNKLVIQRAWGDAQGRLNGLVQLTKGLSTIARRAAKKAA